ncbi:cytochrome P450 9e2-like [Periplaneta americana]|uniref:cytochrome P450 9e2-like n=1 Tax=Periplaneta americana TaxID=6978 RepID=UPI0037E7490F
MDITEILWSYSTWILVVVGLMSALYFYGTRNFNYFEKRNVAFIKPTAFIGTLGPMLFRKQSFSDNILSQYNEMKGHAYGGLFEFSNPIVLLRDPDLIKTVTVKDFDNFTDHRAIVTEDSDPLWGKGIFNLQGQQWKDMRSTLSPAFTSSKMKMMFVLVTECGKQLVDFLEKCCLDYIPDKACQIEKEGDKLVIEMKDLFTRFTNDVIATAAFGVTVDSLKKPSNDFYLLGKEAANFDGVRGFIWLGYALSPKMMKMLRIPLIPNKVTSFFRSLIMDTMSTRDREGIIRPDLIQLLMQAKKGTLQDDKSPANNDKAVLTNDDIAAQAFLFFLGGFDTTSTLLCFASLQLTVNPEIQEKVHKEIDSTLKACGGSITYEALHSMKYLDMVLSETLRLYPPVIAMDRSCVKSYTLPADPPLEMKPGDGIWIPVYALHRDPEYFPDPERFDPGRFSDENKHNIRPFTYFPFGAGPRICIGSRFALMETKIAMVHLLSRFSLKVVSKTPIPIQITRKGFTMTVDGGFWLGLERRSVKQLNE